MHTSSKWEICSQQTTAFLIGQSSQSVNPTLGNPGCSTQELHSPHVMFCQFMSKEIFTPGKSTPLLWLCVAPRPTVMTPVTISKLPQRHLFPWVFCLVITGQFGQSGQRIIRGWARFSIQHACPIHFGMIYTCCWSCCSIAMASKDVGYRAFNALISSNYTTPIIFSLEAYFDPCPMSHTPLHCQDAAPNANIKYASVVYSNSTMRQNNVQFPASAASNSWVLDEDTEQPLHNLLQAIHACMRVELGNTHRNNFILNPSFINNTITAKFPSNKWKPDVIYKDYSTLYDLWAKPPPSFQESYLPVTLPGPANIRVVYPCRFQKRKSSGAFFVSVLVATSSMFSAGWALFMLIATFFAKRADLDGGMYSYWHKRYCIEFFPSTSGNQCDGHCSRHWSNIGPIWSEGELLELQATSDESVSRRMYTPGLSYPFESLTDETASS